MIMKVKNTRSKVHEEYALDRCTEIDQISQFFFLIQILVHVKIVFIEKYKAESFTEINVHVFFLSRPKGF